MNFLFSMSLFTIPKELQILILDFDTLKSFCSSCNSFWNKKEVFAQTLLFLCLDERKVNVYSFTSLLKENKELPLTYYQFANLLVDETYFHLLDPFVKLLSNEKELLPFGIKNCDYRYYRHGLKKNNVYVLYPTIYPKVTFCYKKMTDEEEEIPFLLDRSPCALYNTLVKNKTIRDNDPIEITQGFLMHVRNTVLYKNSADVVLSFIKKGLPIFPSPKKLYEQKNRIKYYEPFFRLVFNNKKVVDTYFTELCTNGTFKSFELRDMLRFLYFVHYYGFVMDFAFKELQKYKNSPNMLLHLEYIIFQRSRHEDSI